MSFDIPEDVYTHIVEYLIGDERYNRRKNSVTMISRWWRKKNIIEEEIYTKNGIIREICRSYTLDMMLRYPHFAINKIRMYSSTVLDTNVSHFTKKSEVREWLKKLPIGDLYLVGV